MNKQKKLLILGAGVYQMPLIKCAKALGIHTVVASIPGNYPGFSIADTVVYKNTVSADEILEAANEFQVDGVCLTGTDVAVITLGTVCDSLRLPGISKSAAQAATSKSLMKDAFLRHGVRTAEYSHVSVDASEKDIEGICDKIGYPVIFKAIDASGSRGIIRVDRYDEIASAVCYVKAATKASTFLVEKFLVGTEFGAQAFVQNGKVEFVLPHGDEVFVGKTGVPVGHFAPYEAAVSNNVIDDEARKAIIALGLDNCAVNIDFMLCDGKVYVLEIGARAGATCLAELVSIYYGFDYYEKIIRVALGEAVDFTPKHSICVPNASRLLTSPKSGTITRIDACIPESVKDSIVDVVIDYKVGDTVRAFSIGPDRIGHVIAKGDTAAAAKAALTVAMDSIKIEVE